MVEVLEASQEEKKGFSEEVEGQWASREMVSHFYLVFLSVNYSRANREPDRPGGGVRLPLHPGC